MNDVTRQILESNIREILDEVNFEGEYRTAHGYPRYEVSSKGCVRAKCSSSCYSKKPDFVDRQLREYFNLYCGKRKAKFLVPIYELVAATFPPDNPAKTWTYNYETKTFELV